MESIQKPIKSSVKTIYLENDISTEIRRGQSYCLSYSHTKYQSNQFLYKDDSLHIKNRKVNFIDKLRSIMRFGGYNAKLIIYVPYDV